MYFRKRYFSLFQKTNLHLYSRALIMSMLLLYSPLINAQNCGCTDCPRAITPNSNISSTIDITGATANNLQSPTQGVCGVIVNFKSPFIWGNRLTLTSPAGQAVTLIGQQVAHNGLNGFSQWTVLFTRNSSPVAPDAGFSGQWNNNQNWAAFSLYSGTYRPYSGALDSFNRGPVNGSWTMRVYNQSLFYTDTLKDFSLIFCDSTGLSCNTNSCAQIREQRDTLCGGCFNTGIRQYCQSGFYIDTFRNRLGCDSIVRRYLVIKNAPITRLNQTICEGGSVLFNDTLRRTTNSYTKIIYNGAASGCDSTIILNLVVNRTRDTTITNTICDGTRIAIGRHNYSTSGVYRDTLQTNLGCDSIVNLRLTVIPIPTTILSDTLCTGQSRWVGNHQHNSSGIFRDTFISFRGCDSLVELHLVVRPCPIETNLSKTNVLCAGGSSGSLNLRVYGGVLPYFYTWQNNRTGRSGGGMIRQSGGDIVISQLIAGQYTIRIFDSVGTIQSLNAEIVQPDTFNISFPSISHFGAFNTSCPDANDGSAIIRVEGGVGPYQINWDNGSADSILLRAQSGPHTAFITDVHGCKDTIVLILTEPPPLIWSLAITPPICFGQKNAKISFPSIQGGTAPYSISLNGTRPQFPSTMSSLTAGRYTISLFDSLGCRKDSIIRILDPPENTVSLTGQRQLILGDSTRLDAQISINRNRIQSINWTPSPSFGCALCSDVYVSPKQTQLYKVQVTDIMGCQTSDSILIKVDPNVSVFAPNIFAPEGEYQNSRFTIFAHGEGLSTIKTLKIFDRWGGLMFEGNDFPPNDLSKGWDGKLNGKPVAEGVYVWYAAILFADGREELIKGDITVVR
jgi:gliding motility-associated-like protein